MECPHCGVQNESDANFCHMCSAKLREVCDCWVKKEPYNCGQDQCPGYRLFLENSVKKDRPISETLHNQS